MEETCKHARAGCKSVELIASKHWPVLKKYGLTCAISVYLWKALHLLRVILEYVFG